MSQENMSYIPLSEPIPITEQIWPEGTKPLVCTRTMTYNHEIFIRECIEGILSQKTTFPVRVCIHDDASTDKTAEIVREYQERYPNLIWAYYQKENSYRSPNKIEMRAEFMGWSYEGKYQALCEGDDYWTDSLKLQDQCEVLENNNNIIICFGGFERKNLNSGNSKAELRYPIGRHKELKNEYGYEFTLNDTKRIWLTKTLTAMMRVNQEIEEKIISHNYPRDVTRFYYYLKNGNGFYLNRRLGVYNAHDGGLHSADSRRGKILNRYYMIKEMYDVNRDNYTRYAYLRVVMDAINYNLYRKEDEKIEDYSVLLRQWFSNYKGLEEVFLLGFVLLPTDKMKRFKKNMRDIVSRLKV
jgi:glycosyltransferase involved in cell wall biosynthesis